MRAAAVDLRACRLGILLTLAGALLGAGRATRRFEVLEKMFRFCSPPVIAYLILSRKSAWRPPARLGPVFFYAVFGPGLGFMMVSLSGTGHSGPSAFVLLCGYNLTRATAHTKG